MFLMSKLHGKLEYEEKDIITLSKEMLGFCGLRRFILKEIEGFEPFKLLHSIEDEEVGFIVISPFDFFKKYEIEINEETIKNLQITSGKDVVLLTTVTLNNSPSNITTNLKAPIIINISNNLGEQIIVDNLNYLIKHPLIKE